MRGCEDCGRDDKECDVGSGGAPWWPLLLLLLLLPAPDDGVVWELIFPADRLLLSIFDKPASPPPPPLLDDDD
jgi:hypothetical protein